MAFDFFGYHGEMFSSELRMPVQTTSTFTDNVKGGIAAPVDAWGNFAPYRPGYGPKQGPVFREDVICAGGAFGCVNVYDWVKN